MKLINTGLGRTGTTSLKAALEILGFSPVYHTTDLLISPKDIDVWEATLQGQAVDWRAFFAKYEVADFPAALFYKEIINAHPEAKVMISVRDPEKWFASASGMLDQLDSINLPIPHVQRVKRFMNTYAVNGLFEGRAKDKEFMVQFFEKHVEGVKQFVPADRLLIYNVIEGWQPLCDFMGVAVPQQPFPHENSGSGFKEFATKLLARVRS